MISSDSRRVDAGPATQAWSVPTHTKVGTDPHPQSELNATDPTPAMPSAYRTATTTEAP
jgi:hypothetical protein